jgi:hypothetical protein
LRQHDRRKLEKRLGQAATAGLPLLEDGARMTEAQKAAWTEDWSARGWIRKADFSTPVTLSPVVSADVRERLDRVAARLGISVEEAALEAEVLGHRAVSARRES